MTCRGLFPSGTPCMMGVVKSRKEDTVLKRKLLRQNLKIGSWNARTLTRTGKITELCDKASRYRLDIVGVQEVRWGGQGKLRLSGGMSFIYSERVTEDHGSGIGLLLSPAAARALESCECILDRLLTARVNCRIIRMTMY